MYINKYKFYWHNVPCCRKKYSSFKNLISNIQFTKRPVSGICIYLLITDCCCYFCSCCCLCQNINF